jgi:hypothetical protein
VLFVLNGISHSILKYQHWLLPTEFPYYGWLHAWSQIVLDERDYTR